MRRLHGSDGSMRVNNASWAMVLRLATDHGWRAAGTEEPVGWTGVAADGETPRLWNPKNYWTRRGQTVTGDDAAALAAALEASLPDIPDHDALGHKVVSRIDLPGRDPIKYLSPFVKFNPYEYFSGSNKARLIRFIGFCRTGGFRIG